MSKISKKQVVISEYLKTKQIHEHSCEALSNFFSNLIAEPLEVGNFDEARYILREMPEGPEKALLFHKIIVTQEGNPKIKDCFFNVRPDGPKGIRFEADSKFNVILDSIENQQIKLMFRKIYGDTVYNYNILPDIDVMSVVKFEPMTPETMLKAQQYLVDADKKLGLEQKPTFGNMLSKAFNDQRPELDILGLKFERVGNLL